MKNLRLKPDIHKQQAIVKVTFAYDRELIDLIKKQKGARWSQCVEKQVFKRNKNDTTTRCKNALKRSLAKPLYFVSKDQDK
jgi:hypothetical protein